MSDKNSEGIKENLEGFHVEAWDKAVNEYELGEDKELKSFNLTSNGFTEKMSQDLKVTFDSKFIIRIKGPPKDLEEEESWEITQAELQEMANELARITRERGKILSYTTEIEQELEEVIEDLLFGSEGSKSGELFRENLLKTRSFSFHDKWKFLRQISKEHEGLNLSDLMDSIRQAKEIRNNFAHGSIIFKDKTPYLKYYGNNEIQYDELNNDYIEGKTQKVTKALKKISSLESNILDGKYETFSGLRPDEDAE